MFDCPMAMKSRLIQCSFTRIGHDWRVHQRHLCRRNAYGSGRFIGSLYRVFSSVGVVDCRVSYRLSRPGAQR